MEKRNAFIMLIAALAVLCSCSAGDGEDYGDLSFSIKDRCKDEPAQALSKSEADASQEQESMDTVFFEVRDDGQMFVDVEIPVSCGDVKFSLHSDVKDDTLFIDAKNEQNVNTSCSCMAELEVDIPNDMLSAKYLVLQRKRYFVKVLAFKG